MQGKKQITRKLYYQLSLEDMVPVDHPYRRIDSALDLRFLYPRTRHYYGKDGQQSIDPVVFFKMCLLGYFNNITSDRKLVKFCEDSLACRLFLGYDLDESLPGHSTLSRTRKLFGQPLYEEVFVRVLALCVDAGLVEGKRQALDSGLIKANASMDAMQRRVIMEDANVYCHQVDEENSEEHSDGDKPTKGTPTGSGTPNGPSKSSSLSGLPPVDADKPHKYHRSNKTHGSPVDPDARIARKPNKPTSMYYQGQISVDGLRGVITGAMADYADRDDHVSMAPLLWKTQKNLSLHHFKIRQLLADSKYNVSQTIALCERAGITAYMSNPAGYIAQREGFVYDAQRDHYTCSQGAILHYKGTGKYHKKYYNRIYRTKPSDCRQCPVRSECITGKSPYKKLTHSQDKALYDRMDKRIKTEAGRWLMSRRKGIVEPVIGNLLHENGMLKVYARGIFAANKHVMMASLTFNLKKWLKNTPGKPIRKGKADALVRQNTLLARFRQISRSFLTCNRLCPSL